MKICAFSDYGGSSQWGMLGCCFFFHLSDFQFSQWCCVVWQLLAHVCFLLYTALKAEIVKAPLLLFCYKHSCSRGERLGLFEWCLSDSGRGEDATGQSWLNNSFALYLFTAEDFLAPGGHLLPVSENSSSAVCWEMLASSTAGAQNTAGCCGVS